MWRILIMRRLILSQIKINDKPSTDIPNMPGIPSSPTPEIYNRIYYTTTDNNIITPYSTSAFGANIISNIYDANLQMCILEFDGDVTQCGSNAFRNRSTIVNVILPGTVTSIGDRAFYYCSNLGSINTGNNINTIGASAFSTCNLTNISIGDKVTSIGTYAFYGCEKLEKIYCNADTPPKGGYSMFEGVNTNCKIYVPNSVVSTYQSASYWSNYSDMILGYDF